MANASVSEIKKKVILDIISASRKLGHSPNRREIPLLAEKCYRYFGSFNKVKLKAGLSIKNVRITKFPKNAFKLDKDLASIASYLTFDGHLYKNLRGLMYSSKNINDLKQFEKVVNRKFGLRGEYSLFSAGSRKQTHKILFFNKKVCEFLFKKGIPKGDKVIQEFRVPNWIYSSKDFSREYLKIAFLCEGSFKEEKGRTPRILFTTAKQIEILNSGIKFTNQLRAMLKRFGIDTHKEYITGRRIRKRDGKVTTDIRFRVKTLDNNKFISEIGWLK